MSQKKILQEITDEKHDMEMTPMIDVTFLLLIFFMCTIKFKTLEGKLSAYLPKDVGVNTSKAEPKEKIDVKLTVLAEGTKISPKTGGPYDPAVDPRFGYGPDRRIQYQVNSRTYTDVKDLRSRLRELFQARPEDPVQIDARKGVVYGDVVVVLDAVIEADFEQVSFAGSYE